MAIIEKVNNYEEIPMADQSRSMSRENDKTTQVFISIFNDYIVEAINTGNNKCVIKIADLGEDFNFDKVREFYSERGYIFDYNQTVNKKTHEININKNEIMISW